MSALRYYERIGLLSPAERAGGRRHYTASSAERVALIRLCQNAGFTLAEIGRLLAARSWGRRGWGHLAERKIAELDARIADAQRAKKLINHALECPHRDFLACPRFRSVLEAQLERSVANTGSRSAAAIMEGRCAWRSQRVNRLAMTGLSGFGRSGSAVG
jgi:DNA-binding transcriptional MerR regulator